MSSDHHTDQDLDAAYKPNGRPQSTMARNFSASLNSAFSIDDPPPHLENLAQSVEQKKAALDSQTSELQALEARIKEMDKRLEQKNSRTSSPAGRVVGGSPHRRQPLGDTFGAGRDAESEGATAPGAAGNHNGAGAGAAQERGVGQPMASSPLADRPMKMPGGVEDMSASSRNQWMPGEGEREAVGAGSEY